MGRDPDPRQLDAQGRQRIGAGVAGLVLLAALAAASQAPAGAAAQPAHAARLR
jgi:hypothetical protein